MARLPRLPDLLTTANLACGAGSILLASQGQLTLACWLVFAAAVFDVFDGLAARAMGGGSPLGAQLDSLADMVSFGVAPAFAVFCQLSTLSGVTNAWTAYSPLSLVHELDAASSWPGFTAAIVLVIASCWRLAKFNVDTRQSTGFLGLPTPANALFWASIIISLHSGRIASDWPMGIGNGTEPTLIIPLTLFTSIPYILFGASLILAALMLSELPLPSLKFKHFRWQGNQVIYLLAGIGAALVAFYGILGVPLILVLYILSPLWGRVFPKEV